MMETRHAVRVGTHLIQKISTWLPKYIPIVTKILPVKTEQSKKQGC